MRSIICKKSWIWVTLCIILGTVNHFLYEWTNENPFVAMFCPVNESTWEHLKLLCFPFIFSSILFYYLKGPDTERFFYSRLLALLFGMLSIIMLFYTYTGALGKHFFLLDISIFVFSVLFSYQCAGYFYRSVKELPTDFTLLLGWLILIISFFTFTSFPPHLPLFLPP